MPGAAAGRRRASATPPAPRTRRTRRNVLTGVLVAGLAVGYLLSSGGLDPVLGDAVTLAEAKLHPQPKDDPASDPKLQRVVDWQYFDGRPEWSSQRGVPQVSGPAMPQAPTRPAIAPPENPIHFRFNGPAPMPTVSLKPLGACPQEHQPGAPVENFSTTVGTRSATASWWDLGDPDAKSYQLAAVPDLVNVGDGSRTVFKPPIVTATVTPPHACKQMTATVSGLITGQKYYLVLQSLNNSNVNTGQQYDVVRAEGQDFTAQ